MLFIIFIAIIAIVIIYQHSNNQNTNRKNNHNQSNINNYRSTTNSTSISPGHNPTYSENRYNRPIQSTASVQTSNNKFSKTTINEHSVEYIDATHTYIVDGRKIPCVSDILSHYARIHYLDDYSHISKQTLHNAALKGTALHNAVEAFERGESYFTNYQEVNNYKILKNIYGFDVLKMEQIVLYCDQQNIPLYAGRLDMIVRQQDEIAILDLKRTYKTYHEKVQLQLNLYRLAYEQSYHQKISKLFCVRLRESQANFFELSIDEETAKDSIYSYLSMF